MSALELEGVLLPVGWRHETSHGATVIVGPSGGVTVDFERRGYALGWVLVRPETPMLYTGRGWRKRLVQDAVDALNRAMRP